jgi:PemK-like, MazF-like toxin of type II toxin-antitoxin system
MGIPEPESGLVISYSYLWREEAETGLAEGRKNRPCAIVLVTQRDESGAPVVTVAPITHSPPQDLSVAVEIPQAVKRHLGLDSERSWIVLDDFNIFTWPGFDLALVPGTKGKYDYGLLPPGLFRTIIGKFAELRRQGRIVPTPRDEA